MFTSITSLTLDIAAEKSIRAARAKLAPIGLFAASFAAATSEKGDTVKVPVFSRGVAAEFASGSNDYTSASSAGVAGVPILLDHHPWQSRRLLPDDAMETDAGRDWAEQTAVTSVESVAASLAYNVLVGAMKATGVGALTFAGGDNTAIKKVARARKAALAAGINPANATLLLPGDLYTDLLTELPFNVQGAQTALVDGYVDKFLGFGRVAELQDPVVYKNDSNKDVTLDAMVVANDAIGIATRLPIIQNPEKYEVSTLSVPEVGPWSFQIRGCGSTSVDAKFLGAELIYGFNVLQPSKVLVASTTEA